MKVELVNEDAALVWALEHEPEVFDYGNWKRDYVRLALLKYSAMDILLPGLRYHIERVKDTNED